MVFYIIGIQAALHQSHSPNEVFDIVHSKGHERNREEVQDIEALPAVAIESEPMCDDRHEHATFWCDFLPVAPFDVTGELYAEDRVPEILWRRHQFSHRSVKEM